MESAKASSSKHQGSDSNISQANQNKIDELRRMIYSLDSPEYDAEKIERLKDHLNDITRFRMARNGGREKCERETEVKLRKLHNDIIIVKSRLMPSGLAGPVKAVYFSPSTRGGSHSEASNHYPGTRSHERSRRDSSGR